MFTIESQSGPGTIPQQGEFINIPFAGDIETQQGPNRRAHRRNHARRRAQSDPRRRNSVDSTPVDTVDIANITPDDESWARNLVDEVHLFGDAAYESDDDNDTLDDAVVPETLADLIDTRARLADISVKSREGALLSNKRADSKLAMYTQEYESAKFAFISGRLALIEENDDSIDNAKRAAFIAALSAKEDGALIGEEANYYLDRHHYKKSALQKSIERYNGFDRKTKVIVGIGAVAASASGIALIGLTAGAAAGAAIATRFGRNYFSQEARRRKDNEAIGLSPEEKLLDLQQNATLKTSRAEDYAAMHEQLKSSTDQLDTYSSLAPDIHKTEKMARSRLESDRKKETSEKRQALAKAAGMVALGSTIGYTVSIWSDGWGSGERANADTPDSGSDPIGSETGSGNNEAGSADSQNIAAQEQARELKEQLAAQRETEAAQAAQAAQAAETALAEKQALYGEFANQRFDIHISDGSNVWDQLEAQIDTRHPLMNPAEKQRIVGNMLAHLQEQNPGRNFDAVNAGESFTLDLTI